MAIISSLAAWLLLLISSFSLAENRKSFSASDSIWMEIETEKSFALSTAAVSNITTTLKPEDENLLREKAVHNMRTGVYTTEVEMCLWNRPDNACKLPSWSKFPYHKVVVVITINIQYMSSSYHGRWRWVW